jgi:O-antigen/teichoic acid export membrane protein
MSLAFLIPRLIIINFGSEVNGILIFASQVISYFSLFEAGLGAATSQTLFKEIAKDDKSSISVVLSTSSYLFKKVAVKYLVATILFSVICPFYLITDIDKLTVFLLLLSQGVGSSVIFYYQAVYKQMFLADGKGYVMSNVTMAVSIISSIVKVVLIYFHFDILFVQLSFTLVTLVQIVVVKTLFTKYYNWVNLNATINLQLFQEKNAILVHQISGLVFSSTNIILLTLFTNLKTVSIYATYNLIFFAIYSLISNVNSSIQFHLGQAYHADKVRFERLFDAYNHLFIMLIYGLMCLIYLIMDPFIMYYTKGADINYRTEYLPLLFSVIQLLDSNRLFSNNLILISGHMGKTLKNTIFEASINLIISLILVQIIGIYGVLIGTIIALLYRSNDTIFYVCRNILNRRLNHSYYPIIVNGILFVIIITFIGNLAIDRPDLFALLMNFISIFCVLYLMFFTINFIFFRKHFYFLFRGNLFSRA